MRIALIVAATAVAFTVFLIGDGTLGAALAQEGGMDWRTFNFGTFSAVETFADTGNENIVFALVWIQRALLSVAALMIALWGWGFLSQSAPTWTRGKHLIIMIIAIAVPGLIVSAIVVILQ